MNEIAFDNYTVVQHQWQQSLIQLELHQWLKNEKQNPKVEEVILKMLNIVTLFVLVFVANNEIDIKLSSTTKEFIEKVHSAYVMHLKVFLF
jgi:hypothetical protein